MFKIFKRAFTLFLIIALLAPNIPNVAALQSDNYELGNLYNDIKGHWAENVLESFIEKGYLKISGNLVNPNEKITRLEVIQVINEILELYKTEFTEKDFIDVKNTDSYYNDVMNAREFKYLSGYIDNTFKPFNKITRYEICAILTRLIDTEIEGYEISYLDKDTIPSWAYLSVLKASKLGFFKGYNNGKFIGTNNISRAELVAVLSRAEEILRQKYVTVEEPKEEEKEVQKPNNNGGSVIVNPPPKPNPDKPKLLSMTPTEGTIGQKIVITGQNLAISPGDISVYFKSPKTGTRKVSYNSINNNKITIISDIMTVETYEVYVVSKGLKSNSLSFESKPLAVTVSDTAAPDFMNSSKLLNNSVKHELSVVFNDTQFFDNLPQNQKNLLSEINSFVTDLNNELDTLLNEFDNLSENEQKLLNLLMSTSVFDNTQSQMSEATELLSHSTTSEALDNINSALESIKDVRDVLDWVKDTLTALIIVAESGGVLLDIFTLGGGVTLHMLANIAATILEIVKPILTTLNIVIAILSSMPTSAVRDSFEVFIKSPDIGIDEGFGTMETIVGNTRYDDKLHRDISNLLALVTKANLEVKTIMSYDSYLQKQALTVIEEALDSSKVHNHLSSALTMVEEIANDSFSNLREFYKNKNNYIINLNKIELFMSKANQFVDFIYNYNYDEYDILPPGVELNLKELSSFTLEGLDMALNNIVYNFNQNYSLDLFNNPQTEAAIDESIGVIYINKPVVLGGSMDFGGNIDIEYMYDYTTGKIIHSQNVVPTFGLDSIISDSLKGALLSVITSCLDLDIQLEDVEVKLALETSDPEILTGEWVDNGLVMTGHKPGLVDVTVKADIKQVRDGTIDVKYASIKRTFYVISGSEMAAPFTSGPRIDRFLNEDGNEVNSAYIGDIITIEGFGFSHYKHKQNFYLGPIENYNDFGMTESNYMKDLRYKTVEIEIPDSVSTDESKLIVGPKQHDDPSEMDKWPSNVLPFTVLDSELHYSHPTAIVGESWPILGRGMSHYGKRNVGYFNDVNTLPIKVPEKYYGLANTAESIANHNYHTKNNYLVPSNITNGEFKVIVAETYETESFPYITQYFSPNLKVSGVNNSIRPSYIINEDNKNGLVVYYDINDQGGVSLVSALGDYSSKEIDNYSIISENIGGIVTAPDKAKVGYSNGLYVVTWVGNGDNNNDIFISSSTDGIVWSEEFNITNSIASSNNPDIELGDFDNDGDADIVLAYTENPLQENDNSRAKAVILENSNNSFTVTLDTNLSIGEGSEVSVDSSDNDLVFSWSEVSENPYSKNIFALHAQVSNLSLTNINRIQVSHNSGKKQYSEMFYEDDTSDIQNLVQFKTASNSQVAIAKNSTTDDKTIFTVWESVEDNLKEDIYFQSYNVQTNEAITQNISNSNKQSQSPVLALDSFNTPAIAWVETGYDFDKDLMFSEGYKSKIYFARSFDNGKTFNKPFIQVVSNTDSKRIGHLSLSGSNEAIYGLVYQYEQGNKNEIKLYSTQNITTANPVIDNQATKPNISLMLRTYSKNPNEKRILIQRNQTRGDVIVSTEDGSKLMKIVRNNSVIGNVSASPNGKYISYGLKYLIIAEADGSHPIQLMIGPDTDIVVDTYFSPSGGYVATNSIGEFTGSYDTGAAINITDIKGTQFSFNQFFNLESSYTPWGTIDGVESIVAGETWDANKGPVSLKSTGNGNYLKDLVSYEIDNSYTFTALSEKNEYIAFIDLDDSIVEDRLYAFGKLYLNKYGESKMTKVSTKARFPIFSKDSMYLVYSNSSNKIIVKAISDINSGSDFKITIESENPIYRPRFNNDSSRLYFLEEESGNRYVLKYYDMYSAQVHNVSPTSGASGCADFLTISSVNLIKEDKITINEGEYKDIHIKLVKEPTSAVNISINHDDRVSLSNNTISFSQSDWDQLKNITINAIDDEIDYGVSTSPLRFSITSDDTFYNNSNVSITAVEIIDNDMLDEIEPTWPEGSFITISNNDNDHFDASWNNAEDNIGVDKYLVQVWDDSKVFEEYVTDTSVSVTGLDPKVTYNIIVVAYDANSNTSADLTLQVSLNDTMVPFFPENPITNTHDPNLSITAKGTNYIEYDWDDAIDNVGMSHYILFLDDVEIGTSTDSSYTLNNLDADTLYTFGIRPVDTSGNLGKKYTKQEVTKAAGQFKQGEGFMEFMYQDGAIHPSSKQWNGMSRYEAPQNFKLSYSLDNLGDLNPVVDKDGNVYTTTKQGALVKINPNGEEVWKNESLNVIDEIFIGENVLHVVDENLGICAVPFSTGTVNVSYKGHSDYFKVNQILGINKYNNAIVLEKNVDYDSYVIYVLSEGYQKAKGLDGSYHGDFVLLDNGWIVFATDGGNYLTGYDLTSNEDYLEENNNYFYISIPQTTGNTKVSLFTATNANNDIFAFVKEGNELTGSIISYNTSNIENGEVTINWENNINTSIYGDITITDNGRIYFLTTHHSNGEFLHALNANNGSTIWQKNISYVGDSRPIVDSSGNIIFLTKDVRIVKVSPLGNIIEELQLKPNMYIKLGNPMFYVENKGIPILVNNAIYVNCYGLVKVESKTQTPVISVADYTLAREEDEKAIISVQITNNNDSTNYVHYSITDITATKSTDYTSNNVFVNVLTFNSNESEKLIEIPIINDEILEQYESFKIEISDPSGGAVISNTNSVGYVAIRDDEAQIPIGFENIGVTASEEDNKVVVKVVRQHDATTLRPCSVYYYTNSSEGAAETGYVHKEGTLEFAEGESEKEIEINLINDEIHQDTRYFYINLNNPKFVDLDDTKSAVTVAIEDTDNLATVEFNENSPLEIEEQESVMSFTITRSEENNGSKVALEISGTATYESDYEYDLVSSSSELLTFSEGELSKTINITIKEDTELESPETIVLTLVANEDSDLQVGTKGSIEITINDNDSVKPNPPIVVVDRPGVYNVTCYNVQNGATIKVYDSNNLVVKTVECDNDNEWFDISDLGIGYYCTQTFNGIESDPSNTFSIVNDYAENMAEGFEGSYTYDITYTITKDEYNNEWIEFNVSQPLPQDRYLFFFFDMSLMETPFNGAVLANIFDGGLEVSPEYNTTYQLPANLQKNGDMVTVVETDGTTYTSNILGYIYFEIVVEDNANDQTKQASMQSINPLQTDTKKEETNNTEQENNSSEEQNNKDNEEQSNNKLNENSNNENDDNTESNDKSENNNNTSEDNNSDTNDSNLNPDSNNDTSNEQESDSSDSEQSDDSGSSNQSDNSDQNDNNENDSNQSEKQSSGE